ncbi:Sulfotransferase family protein [Friedmanniella luteola]|uniref:Sulfotransferase family protein n=1 Tax=Friedmanniella luteola TaxID=546871 RepID=A0A1H1LQ33_9ACTN|nr:sulfotransferase [Friedmanniella luteola]SDR76497.1 Sulfotransferase family protein [Friedmanniella luteola]
MSTREPRPDALLVGAPKAGTSALHAALRAHPQIWASPVKEPKFYLCGEAPPPAYRGPGDAHSQQEWVWRRRNYEALFADAPPASVRLESTPFYLYSPDARRRIAEELPDAKLVVVVRDPVDRAYSNWTHLWADGLEPEADFVRAWRDEDRRVDAGWAPFWHYRRMGRYGEQLADLFSRVERERVLVLRYRELVSEPVATLDRVSRFLGVDAGCVGTVPPDNSRGFVEDGPRTRALALAVRAGAAAGAFAPPQVWRRASRPLVAALQRGGPSRRPRLTPEQRGALLADVADDVDVLEEVLGESFADWRSGAGRGSFSERTGTA